jgi:methylmalonyl-CoA mutase N-terminal domain/subunit
MTKRLSQSGISLKPFYTPQDLKDFDYRERLNDPGSYPFSRGRRAEVEGSWIQRELSGEGDPARSNEQFKYLLSKGQMGIDVIGDTPTMACLDPDHPLAAKALGTQGVSLCCLQDYEQLYKELPLESVTISQSLPAAFALAGFYLVAQKRGIPPSKLRGSVVQAPFYCEDCGYSMQMPFNLRVRLASNSIEFCSREMPKFHAFLEDTYYISEAGLDAVEEMALGFVEMRHIIKDLLGRGVDIDQFAPRIAILVNCRMDIFDEIAKIRATRKLFARMMKEEFGAKDPRSLSVVIASHTSGLSLTAQQPFNNIVRGSLQALALVLAGVQAIEISAFDEAYRTPSPESHLVGLRTQQVIHLETDAANVVDPLGGSYFLESITGEMEKKIWQRVMEIEKMGAPADLSDKGWFKNIFNEAMEQHVRKLEQGELQKVGVNILQIPEDEDTLLKEVAKKKMEPCWERIEKIKDYKKQRSPKKIKEVLKEVYDQARNREENIMPSVIRATAAGATMGEIAGFLRLAYDYPYDPFGLVESPLSSMERAAG